MPHSYTVKYFRQRTFNPLPVRTAYYNAAVGTDIFQISADSHGVKSDTLKPRCRVGRGKAALAVPDNALACGGEPDVPLIIHKRTVQRNGSVAFADFLYRAVVIYHAESVETAYGHFASAHHSHAVVGNNVLHGEKLSFHALFKIDRIKAEPHYPAPRTAEPNVTVRSCRSAVNRLALVSRNNAYKLSLVQYRAAAGAFRAPDPAEFINRKRVHRLSRKLRDIVHGHHTVSYLSNSRI